MGSKNWGGGGWTWRVTGRLAAGSIPQQSDAFALYILGIKATILRPVPTALGVSLVMTASCSYAPRLRLLRLRGMLSRIRGGPQTLTTFAGPSLLGCLTLSSVGAAPSA